MTATPEQRRSVRQWLIVTAIAVVATIAVGGGTRLTESGLSITVWEPVTGVIPPLGEAAWNEAFQSYLRIPEAQTVHAGITLSQFKGLFWWEWAHRFVARGAGLVIAVPFFWLWWRGRIPRPLLGRLALLPVLVAAQGALGWYMVTSGLSDRTSVSPYRLVAHLGLALVIFAIAVWTAASLGDRADGSGGQPDREARRWLLSLTALVAVTILTGGFVAGLDAGRIYNEFPLMGGQLVPLGYGAVEGWRNMFENPVAAQFHHRVLAVVTAAVTWSIWLFAERRRWLPTVLRWLRLAAGLAALQTALGIATLLLAVPVTLGVLHQLGAVAVLTAMLLGAQAAMTVPARVNG
jgi:cytochrome c oxidase assembly protein subunit 15